MFFFLPTHLSFDGRIIQISIFRWGDAASWSFRPAVYIEKTKNEVALGQSEAG